MKKIIKKFVNSKKNGLSRRFFILLIGVVFLTAGIYIINFLISSPGRLEVDYLDVGQGDSELIKTPNHKLILIDGGPDNLVLWRLGEVLPFYRKKIDYIFLSHFHEDHLTGLIEILKRYQVLNFVHTDNLQSDLLDNLLKVAAEQHTKVIAVKNLARIDLETNCFFNLLNPKSLNVPDDQNNSLIAKLNCAKNTFLFSGDNSFIVERALLKSGFDLKATVLKASHHGSKSASSEAFLRAVSPSTFVISDGLNNKFNHPSPEIVERAKTLGLKIFRTDKQGTIRIFGDIR